MLNGCPVATPTADRPSDKYGSDAAEYRPCGRIRRFVRRLGDTADGAAPDDPVSRPLSSGRSTRGRHVDRGMLQEFERLAAKIERFMTSQAKQSSYQARGPVTRPTRGSEEIPP
jgi:hypothetical protein